MSAERGDDGVNRYLKSEIEHLLKENSTLIAQRERLLEALKGVAIMLNTELEKYDNEPWAQRVREAIATSEQEGRTRQ